MNQMAALDESTSPRLRPGERREPLLVTLAPEQHAVFVRECRTEGVAPERAYALLIERRLLLDDLRAGGPEIAAVLDDAARDVRAELALDGPSSSYLRSFSRPTSVGGAVAATLLIPVPLRFYARACALAPEAIVESGGVAQAIAWERASVARGRTLTEWGLVTALSAYVIC
jgi:hypothetical protein